MPSLDVAWLALTLTCRSLGWPTLAAVAVAASSQVDGSWGMAERQKSGGTGRTASGLRRESDEERRRGLAGQVWLQRKIDGKGGDGVVSSGGGPVGGGAALVRWCRWCWWWCLVLLATGSREKRVLPGRTRGGHGGTGFA